MGKKVALHLLSRNVYVSLHGKGKEVQREEGNGARKERESERRKKQGKGWSVKEKLFSPPPLMVNTTPGEEEENFKN